MDGTAPVDMENVKPHHNREENEAQAREAAIKHRTASFLAFLSLILLAESVYRIVAVAPTPEGGWGLSEDVFPPAALVTGGVFEFLFAALGLFVGLGLNMFELGHRGLTMVLLGTQAVLGLYVYIVFTIALPAFYIDRQVYRTSNAISASVFGWLFTSMGYDGLLQAGQFLLALQLYHLQSGTRLSSRYYKPRLIVMSALVFLVGLGTFICGVLVRVILYNDLYYAYPNEFTKEERTQMLMRGLLFGAFNAIRFTPITIVSGLVIMLYSLMSLGSRVSPAVGYGVFVWLWMMSAHVLAQYGSIPLAPGMLGAAGLLGAEAVLTALMATVMVLVPLYFGMEAWRADAESG